MDHDMESLITGAVIRVVMYGLRIIGTRIAGGRSYHGHKRSTEKILVSIIQAGTLAKISIIGSHGMQPGPKLRILRSSRNQKRRPLAPADQGLLGNCHSGPKQAKLQLNG